MKNKHLVLALTMVSTAFLGANELRNQNEKAADFYDGNDPSSAEIVDYCEVHKRPVYLAKNDQTKPVKNERCQVHNKSCAVVETECVCDDCCWDWETDFCNRESFQFTAEFLYWGTNYNLPFSLLNNQSTVTTNPQPLLQIDFKTNQIQVIRTKNSWSPGFRVAVGDYLDYEDIDLQLIGTYYENHSKKSVVAPNNILFGNNFTGTDGNLQLLYRVADFEMGKTFDVNSSIVLRPFVGVRGGWLDQDHRVHYTGNTTTTVMNPSGGSATFVRPTPSTIHLDQDLWAVGPRIGLNTTWFKAMGFSLLTNISSSLLYGKMHQKATVFNISQSTSSGILDESQSKITVRDEFWELFPTLQLLMGLNWEYCECDDLNYRLYAAWEGNFWWEASTVLFFDRAISTQGLTAGVSVGF